MKQTDKATKKTPTTRKPRVKKFPRPEGWEKNEKELFKIRAALDLAAQVLKGECAKTTTPTLWWGSISTAKAIETLESLRKVYNSVYLYGPTA